MNLEEYVKMGDDIYKVDPAPVDLDDKLKHERTLVFDVSTEPILVFNVSTEPTLVFDVNTDSQT